MREGLYYSLAEQGTSVVIDIFGDITSYPWCENDVSSYGLAKALEELSDDISEIHVHINSYGGEVAEGLAIYNRLRDHEAKVTTYCDGFACSAASVVFMAGNERVMSDASLLMIHNAWTRVRGNADELRKQADDLDVITSASKAAYLAHATISEEELSRLMDAETWIAPDEAVEMGLATSIACCAEGSDAPAQHARQEVYQMVMDARRPIVQLDQADVPQDAGEETEKKQSAGMAFATMLLGKEQ